MNPPLEETFAGNVWRVEDCPGNPAGRFVVVATSPGSSGAEVDICACQYRPHAAAIAALPELARAVTEARDDIRDLIECGFIVTNADEYLDHLVEAIGKAEERKA